MWEPQSCCCFRLRTGSIIIGFLSLISAILNIINFIRIAINGTAHQLAHQLCSGQTHSAEVFTECAHLMLNLIFGLVGVDVVTSFIQLILSIILICGIFKNKSRLLIPYMIMCLINIIILILIALALIILAGLHLPGWYVVIIIIVFGAWIFWATFLLLVIRTHYLEMKRENPGHMVLK
ncbi:lysosomal-associated transmembrane protein 5 [Procambarus clarkii]|uniref:lysosomal-associated transmembrane protein 5 n=1 Tax=Procambarus clarkii TaxID=6728 RepID=UPI003742AC73